MPGQHVREPARRSPPPLAKSSDKRIPRAAASPSRVSKRDARKANIRSQRRETMRILCGHNAVATELKSQMAVLEKQMCGLHREEAREEATSELDTQPPDNAFEEYTIDERAAILYVSKRGHYNKKRTKEDQEIRDTVLGEVLAEVVAEEQVDERPNPQTQERHGADKHPEGESRDPPDFRRDQTHLESWLLFFDKGIQDLPPDARNGSERYEIVHSWLSPQVRKKVDSFPCRHPSGEKCTGKNTNCLGEKLMCLYPPTK